MPAVVLKIVRSQNEPRSISSKPLQPNSSAWPTYFNEPPSVVEQQMLEKLRLVLRKNPHGAAMLNAVLTQLVDEIKREFREGLRVSHVETD